MKSVLISIQPKWCELIASGKKTVEVRKTRPKLETPFKCYIYCTHGAIKKMPRDYLEEHLEEGKVIGEFVCDEITEYPYETFNDGEHFMPYGELEKTCLDGWELYDYLGTKDGYGWHISDLVIYDKPRELGEFKLWNCRTDFDENGYPVPTHEIKRPFQSWGYVYEADT
jgi:predicted transcriptional regulator